MKDKEYIIRHRMVGYPEQVPAKTTLFADSRDDAKIKFLKYHWDLNVHIVGVELLKCEVIDKEGNHCPEPVEHLVFHNDNLVNLCPNCYANLLNGAYQK